MTESPLTRLLRALLLAAAAVVLLGLVAVAAGGYRLGGGASAQPSPYAVDSLLTLVLALYTVGAIALLAGSVWAGFERRKKETPRGRRQRTIRTALIGLGLLAVLLLVSQRFHWHLRHVGRPPSVTGAAPSGGAGHLRTGHHGQQRQAHFRLLPFLIALGAASAAFGAFSVAERRRRRRLPREAALSDELLGALDQSLDELRTETDPRRAVIAAYARMERVLALHGIPRRRSEAPHEYLGRVLAELTHGGRAARRLTSLFERARFSPHDVAPAMKAEAIAAFEAFQAELAAAETEAAA
ncbi:MAG TPA: DUF4129 domain-containing protein [Gaiellaceae bacterium]